MIAVVHLLKIYNHSITQSSKGQVQNCHFKLQSKYSIVTFYL